MGKSVPGGYFIVAGKPTNAWGQKIEDGAAVLDLPDPSNPTRSGIPAVGGAADVVMNGSDQMREQLKALDELQAQMAEQRQALLERLAETNERRARGELIPAPANMVFDSSVIGSFPEGGESKKVNKKALKAELEGKTADDLNRIAAERGVEVKSNMNKEALVNAIVNHEAKAAKEQDKGSRHDRLEDTDTDTPEAHLG